MCLLTFMPEGINIDYDKALEAAKSNPHGFGFAIHSGATIIKDHDMSFGNLWARWEKLREIERGPAIFHFRITTHGLTDVDNCHPFNVGDDDKTVLAHNGILPIVMPVHETRSDTKIFAEYILPRMGGVTALDNKETFESVEEWASGSKLVVLSVNPLCQYDWYIINESHGHWLDGMWWSNKSYIKYTPLHSTYWNKTGYNLESTRGMYSDWDVDDDDYLVGNLDPAILEQHNADDYECLINDIYEDSSYLPLIRIFTEFNSTNQTAIATCYECANVYQIDPYEASATHCGNCKNCLGCGNSKCNCWDDYEYGQSFLVWDNPNQEILNYE